nr:putative ribonuclease H-like domain-containing protein [Tanacetum cinerariifolium]
FQDTEKAGEEGTQTYVLFPVLSDGSTNSQNNNKDALVDKKEHHDDIQKSVSPDIHSSSSGAQTRKQEFEECSNNSSNGVNAASSSVSTAGRNSINSTNDFSTAGPSNAAMSNLEDLSHDADDVGAEADINNLESIISTRSMARTVRDQEHTQEEGIDYEEVFAPVARIEAIRLFLAYDSFMGFLVYQMDVKSAFLYGTIEEEVYVCQTPGFEDPKNPDKVYKVVKALYGLHQAPRAWYETLATYLLENGFHRGTIEQTLFIKKQQKDILLVQIYVDDIIFGELTFFLGLQVKQKKDGVFISQDKYVPKILKKFGLSERKSASTPIDAEKPLLKESDGEDVDVHTYRSMIGSLMYLTFSRPDIMFAVCACIRFQVTPKVSHLNAVKRIFRYLKGKPYLGLWYPKDSPFDLVAYSDGDYAGASLDRTSTTGGCQFLGCKLISWQCKKQTVVATSSTKAEYVAAASGYTQIFAGLAQMGYEKPSSKLTFYKAFFSSQRKFLIHTILQSLSAKRNSWNKFSTAMASAVICLSKGHRFNFSREEDAEEEVQVPTHDAVDQENVIEESVDDQVLDKYSALVHRVEGLKSANTAQILEILKLKAREDSKVQEVVEVVNAAKLITEVVTAATTQVIPAAESVVAAVSTPISAAKPKGLKAVPATPTISTRKRKEVVIRDPEKELHDDTPIETQSAKDKGKGIFVKDPKPIKKKDQIVMDAEYARKLQEEEESLAQAKDAQTTDVQPKDAQEKGIQSQQTEHGQALVKSWKLLTSCVVHIITFTTTMFILLVEKKYPLSRFTLEQLVNVARLQVKEESKMSLELLRFTRSNSWNINKNDD